MPDAESKVNQKIVRNITNITMKLKHFFLLVLLTCTCFVYGQKVDAVIKNDSLSIRKKTLSTFKKDIYISGSDSMHYRLLYTANYNKKKLYSIVVFLAGDGERGNDNEKQLCAILNALINDAGRAKYACFILAPQCPPKRLWVHFPNFPNSLQATAEPTFPAKWTFELLNQLMKKLPIDLKRIYITGYSGGGEGTFDFLTRRPQLFTAAIPICSVSDTAKARTISRIPIWAFHGDKDEINDVKYSRLMIAALRKKGGEPKYTEYLGMGHNIINKSYNEPGLFDWLFSQIRGPIKYD
ncbi:MAG: dienelactone hydrolase family protein [Mucilaginibacter sp.]|uniref:carboxylesterase family protein n=1 Tax=Mucilaginibacter sp. TaxID=1882438 RepID=UPI0034E4AD4C